MSKLRYTLKLVSITPFNTTCNLFQKLQGFSKITPFAYVHCNSRYCSAQRNARTQDGPGLRDFIFQTQEVEPKDGTDKKEIVSYGMEERVPYVRKEDINGKNCKVYFETYGCQMNVNDTEVAWSVLSKAGYEKTLDLFEADVILAVTCAIRENAESKIWKRLELFKKIKQQRPRNLPPLRVGLLGCMAERLKEELLNTDKKVDLVAGPDAYRDLPRLLAVTETGQAAVNVLLSLDETYADIVPVRLNQSSPTAFVSVMRGCDNMCSFCIVPFTRGRERSRPMESILSEIRSLSDEGVKEVTLLGQNVNSYRDLSSTDQSSSTHLSRGFSSIYRSKEGGRRFSDLLDKVAQVDPEMRIRFTSPHSKDFPDELLQVIQDNHNICNNIHLPIQSGSTRLLKLMRRGHTREAYLELADNIRSTIPGVTLSSDFIAGFCEETEEDHKESLSLLRTVQYDIAYLFAYSMRKKTHAYHRMKDTVPDNIKKRRLQELVDTFYSLAKVKNQKLIGSEQLVLVESTSKRSVNDLKGRTDGNHKVIFPSCPLPKDRGSTVTIPTAGDYVKVKITSATSLTLRGEPLCITRLQSFNKL